MDKARQMSKPWLRVKRARLIALAALTVTAGSVSGARAADVAETKSAAEASAPPDPWNGFYFGGHIGRAGGRSNWSGPDIWGSSGLAKQIDTFTETGSFFEGFQGGY